MYVIIIMIPTIRRFTTLPTVTTDYGEVSNQDIVYIFGQDMTYCQLRKRGKKLTETAYLTTKVETHRELVFFTAYLDKEVLYDDELT